MTETLASIAGAFRLRHAVGTAISLRSFASPLACPYSALNAWTGPGPESLLQQHAEAARDRCLELEGRAGARASDLKDVHV